MIECPSCDREFSSEHGVKVHHSQSHGESIRGEKLNCNHCGQEYRRQPAFAEGSKYCSQQCQNDSRRIAEDVIKVCEECGNKYSVKFRNRKESKYCSEECQADSRRLEKQSRNCQEWINFSKRYRAWVGKCESCQSEENLHVHHDTPIFQGGELFDNTFTVLCQSCHLGDWNKWHQNY